MSGAFSKPRERRWQNGSLGARTILSAASSGCQHVFAGFQASLLFECCCGQECPRSGYYSPSSQTSPVWLQPGKNPAATFWFCSLCFAPLFPLGCVEQRFAGLGHCRQPETRALHEIQSGRDNDGSRADCRDAVRWLCFQALCCGRDFAWYFRRTQASDPGGLQDPAPARGSCDSEPASNCPGTSTPSDDAPGRTASPTAMFPSSPLHWNLARNTSRRRCRSSGTHRCVRFLFTVCWEKIAIHSLSAFIGCTMKTGRPRPRGPRCCGRVSMCG